MGGGKFSFNDRYGSEDLRFWRWAPPKAIGVVTIQGDITQGRARPGPGILGSGGAGAEDVIDALQTAEEDDDVKAVVLRVESPGGDSLASDLIWNAVGKLRKTKPVISSFGDVAASGGYYAAVGTDLIVAEPTTLTGSIGVFALTFEVRDLMERFGVTTWEETRGKLAGAGWHRPMTEEEQAVMQRFVGITYETFLSRVKDGRKMPMEKVRELAQGRVWTGAQAKEVGLVDELGGIAEAIELAKAKVGLTADDTAEVRLISGKDDPVTRWTSALNVTADLFTGEKRREERLREAVKFLLGDPEALDRAVRASNSRALALMPYTVTIR
jgi:protease-4